MLLVSKNVDQEKEDAQGIHEIHMMLLRLKIKDWTDKELMENVADDKDKNIHLEDNCAFGLITLRGKKDKTVELFIRGLTTLELNRLKYSASDEWRNNNL